MRTYLAAFMNSNLDKTDCKNKGGNTTHHVPWSDSLWDRVGGFRQLARQRVPVQRWTQSEGYYSDFFRTGSGWF